ncbi:hypothetical protein HDU67_000134 [Dinochytrium kinnereticum]|nr:hypothetical protein HDU67_000134 [Dinochytrium kinnereticum]
MASASVSDSVFAPGRVAVITGAASGIGKAMAARLASIGMQVVLVDRDETSLVSAVSNIKATHPTAHLHHHAMDVTDAAAFQALARSHPNVHFLMNNAGTGVGGPIYTTPLETWKRCIDVNFYGVLNGVQAFLPSIAASSDPCIIVNVGSKQGITCPPGNLPYNVSKAALKVFSEGLEHEVRNDERMKGRVSTHLLVPGWVNTGFFVNVKKETSGPDIDTSTIFSEENPAKGAWNPNHVVDYTFEGIQKNRFYIVCPDNEVDAAMDRKRILWAAGDIVNDRSPLSRWDAKYSDEFKAFEP